MLVAEGCTQQDDRRSRNLAATVRRMSVVLYAVVEAAALQAAVGVAAVGVISVRLSHEKV